MSRTWSSRRVQGQDIGEGETSLDFWRVQKSLPVSIKANAKKLTKKSTRMKHEKRVKEGKDQERSAVGSSTAIPQEPWRWGDFQKFPKIFLCFSLCFALLGLAIKGCWTPAKYVGQVQSLSTLSVLKLQLSPS